jgi:thioredoxin 1
MKKILGLVLVLGVQMNVGHAAVLKMAGEKTVSKYFTEKSEEEGIEFFHGTWSEALKKAEEDNKLIFLDAYAAWCGPCKYMAKKTFTDPDVGAFYNQHFINFKMDMEKGTDGPRLSRKFGLQAYPTLYFINGKEEVVHKKLGFHEAKEFIALGRVASEMK